VEALGRSKIASAAGVVLALTIFAVGCTSENAHRAEEASTQDDGQPVVAAAGDIASCIHSGFYALHDLW
jgi:hypothetical protein